MLERGDLWPLLDKMQMNARAMSKQIDDVRMLVAAEDLGKKGPVFRCVPCGQTFKSTFSLDEHNWRKHDGALPRHMAKLERLTLGEVIGE